MIRELLYETQCDPNTLNRHGKTAAFMYFINLLTKANDSGSDQCLTVDEINCFTELLWFTYNTQKEIKSERHEVFDMIDYCFQFSDVPIRKLYMEIVNVFIGPAHPRRYFVETILETKLASDYCLIASMFEMNELLKDSNFISLRSNFLSEMFALFLANKPFFEEYIAEVMSTGWTFNLKDQSKAFCTELEKHQSTAQHVCGFIKYLIRYEIDFNQFLKLTVHHLPSKMADHIAINVFVPLSKLIHVPIELAIVLGQRYPSELSCYNFNETEYVLDDYNSYVNMDKNAFQVVSLKNLSRLTLRKYFFQKHTHYRALSLLYSLNIPLCLRNFLCYNYCNLKF